MFIDLTDLKAQEAVMQCPYCYEDMTVNNIIGETEYDVARIWHDIGGMATVFECPKCFEKSFIHKESLKWKI
jgi:uncharacterized Zn-finger protein